MLRLLLLLLPLLRSPTGKRYLHTANVGDARAVLSYRGKAVPLTYDHKATDEKEQKRIEEAGGFVLRGRVLGILAVARSFGDHSLKQFVSARPHITITEIRPEHDFLALCCDGVFDVMENDDVVRFIAEHSVDGTTFCSTLSLSFNVLELVLKPMVTYIYMSLNRPHTGPNPDISRLIVEEALKRRSTDNITAMVVYL